jgi:hypothetical protein
VQARYCWNGYPTGISFYRLFSYRQGYIHPGQLADQLRDHQRRVSLLATNSNEGLFGVRFKAATDSAFVPIFVPLRKVEIVRVDTSDQINMHFKLGAFVKPIQGAGTSQKVLPKMDLTSVLPQVQQTTLFVGLRDVDAELVDMRSSSPGIVA